MITKYAGPAPPSGDGPHRYVILVFGQPAKFKAPAGLTDPGTAVALYDFPKYVQVRATASIVNVLSLTHLK